jgi:hypothetical protein
MGGGRRAEQARSLYLGKTRPLCLRNPQPAIAHPKKPLREEDKEDAGMHFRF